MRARSLLALALLLPACDAGTPEPPLPDAFGRFEAEISGGLSRSLAGTATFYEIPSPAGEGTSISITMMDPGGPRRSLSFTDYGGAFADEGTYSFSSDRIESGIALLYMDDALVPSAFYPASDGVVRIERSDDERIVGTFEARIAAPLGPGSGSESAVTGSFEAVPLPARPR